MHTCTTLGRGALSWNIHLAVFLKIQTRRSKTLKMHFHEKGQQNRNAIRLKIHLLNARFSFWNQWSGASNVKRVLNPMIQLFSSLPFHCSRRQIIPSERASNTFSFNNSGLGYNGGVKVKRGKLEDWDDKVKTKLLKTQGFLTKIYYAVLP